MGHPHALCKPARIAFAHRKPDEAVTIVPVINDIMACLTLVASVLFAKTSWLTCGFALATATFALQGYRRLRGTTLTAPCLWVAASATCLAAGAILEHRLEGISLSATRFAVATTTLCPLMAVLGAKRPQDRGWQWVVLTLWIILVWPAAQAVALPAGVRVDLFVAWKIFLWGLIAIGLLNYLPTIHWRATILVSLGQILLLRDHLGLSAAESTAVSDLVATLSFLSAAALVHNSGTPKVALNSDLSPITSKWLDFRNHYGAFWALRTLGQLNHTAELRDWPVQLDWSGFLTIDDHHPTDEQLAEINQSIDSMLRRFVELAPS
ncbi:MAG: hypothetical protein AAGD11_12850 [Planctomycetota bacterium]